MDSEENDYIPIVVVDTDVVEIVGRVYEEICSVSSSVSEDVELLDRHNGEELSLSVDAVDDSTIVETAEDLTMTETAVDSLIADASEHLSPEDMTEEEPFIADSGVRIKTSHVLSPSLDNPLDPKQFHADHFVFFKPPPRTISQLPLGSRMFVGNISSDRTNQAEIARIFAKYGNIYEIILRGTYGFIQFDTIAACEDAIKAESGKVIAGLTIGNQALSSSHCRLQGVKGPQHNSQEPSSSKVGGKESSQLWQLVQATRQCKDERRKT